MSPERFQCGAEVQTKRLLSPTEYDCMTVGEMSGTTPEKGLTYVHPDRKELQMVSARSGPKFCVLADRLPSDFPL